MRRILIQEVDHLAQEFKECLKLKKRFVSGTTPRRNPEEKLRALINTHNTANVNNYIKEIANKWDKLIVAKPSEFNAYIKVFESIIAEPAIVNYLYEGKVNNKVVIKKKSLSDAIIQAMGYQSEVRPEIYPYFMGKLDIKTCVYCNAQYTIHVDGYDNYELDHFLPESKYPYLCTSFYNLQPSCGCCNRSKREKDARFNLYTENPSDLYPFWFSVSESGLALYKSNHDINALEIEFHSNDAVLLADHESHFYITKQYQAHKDVAAEMIWKSNKFNKIYRAIYRKLLRFSKLSDADFDRFVLGNYMRKEQLDKRPLALMEMGIAKQLKLIKNIDNI